MINSALNKLKHYLDIKNVKLDKPPNIDEISKKNKERKMENISRNKEFAKKEIKSTHNKKNEINMDKLVISKLVDSIGSILFGDNDKINKLIDEFINYFSSKYEITAEFTEKIISMFKFVMNKIECSISVKIKYNTFKKELEEQFSEHLAHLFINKFVFDKQYNKVPDSTNKFRAKTMLQDYERFLGCFGYCQSGYIYTGIFTLWRALLRFLDSIQKEPDFYKWKGAELEKWCYYQAIQNSIECRKLIIQNEDEWLSKRYFDMKKQIENFPIKPIIISAPLSKEIHISFLEFDLLLRIGDYIIALEAKTRRIPPGSRELPFLWFQWYEKIFLKHRFRTKILAQLINKNYLNDKFFSNVKKVIPMVVSTEGIISSSYGTDYKILPYLFEQWKKSIERGIIPKVKISRNEIEKILNNEEIKDFAVINAL